MEGYAKLANLMGDDQTDGHFLIFQKFEPLSAQNLLYLQAELINLREQLDIIVRRDAESSDSEKILYVQDWEELSSSENSLQWEKWVDIRSKLKEYYEAIAQHRMITALPAPNSYDLKFLQQWLERPQLGNCAFVGADCDVYEAHKAAGLVSLASHGREVDAMTRLLVHKLPSLYHRAVVNPLHRFCGWWIKKPAAHRDLPQSECRSPNKEGSKDGKEKTCTATGSTTKGDSAACRPGESESLDLESNVFFYRDTHIYRVATILGTLLSSLIPIAAIIVLSLVENMRARLGIVSVFTAVFSVSLSLVTEGKRVEIFAATAAFASVQVVFVGSTNWGKVIPSQ